MLVNAWSPLSPKKFLRAEALLILAICMLVLQITFPSMIRWWQLPSPGRVGIDYLDEKFSQEFKAPCTSQRYLAYLPEQYYQKDAWPLVIYLHGSGSCGSNPNILRRLADILSAPGGHMSEALVLMPQCTPRRGWNSAEIIRLVELFSRRYRVDRQRIYLTGYSMGAYGTWETAAKAPEVFAAIVTVAGGNNPEIANSLTKMPIWAFHGELDNVVPANQSTVLIQAIRKLGGAPQLTIYPEAGHGICERVFQAPELWHWLFNQNLEREKASSISASSQKNQE